MDYKKLFDEYCASKPDELISFSTAFQLLDFVDFLNKKADVSHLSPCGICSEKDKPVYYCHHQPNGTR